ncbi:UDP-N-acetylmuramoyl-L-alanine--D-glutamate ligase [Ferroacidibacillus organovorans]|uniref:UDP-N-acetylmuramoylalanine--D-glutamate ligase n=1 Tax=Ferroacidibacillus organovorans TaxID=1765683 RepID=A0A1V4ETN9_9BACL|nr:UDP-N-acetylmuramoyl-L-alanine--D-glutamate ligase [Ferroacidibacillus organovorans]OPG16222.1 UDP-N-acetylmuramoyl-L-alanine--D-glutamate ligase [Ferroacidibacillus organovorans]
MDLKNQRVLVVGLARSGVAAAKLLHKKGAQVVANDASPRESLRSEIETLQPLGIPVVSDGHPFTLLDSVSLIVKNPGIPYHMPLIAEALARSIPIVTEVELAFQSTTAPIIGITGSNGKTTTTTLVGAMFLEADIPARVAGNIGLPLSEAVLTAQDETVLIVELSSFQLQGTSEFRPRIATVLNLYPAHLDYHGSFEAYARAKENICTRQGPMDRLILNMDNEHVRHFADHSRAKVAWFSRLAPVPCGVYAYENHIYVREAEGVEPICLLSIDKIQLPGSHNLENILAATATAFYAGVPIDAITATLQTFRGVEHRLEYVRSVNGVDYYNDSKATNPKAALSAIRALDKPLVVLLGGLERGDDLKELSDGMRGCVKAVIALGQSRERMADAARQASVPNVHIAASFAEAVALAAGAAQRGDAVLLSPAAASWDQFKSFEERGSIFKELVNKL